jgi:adenylate cyclase
MNWLRKLGLPLVCAALALLTVLLDPVALQVLRNAQFDQFQRWQPRVYEDVGVLIVDLDEESLKQIGQWPWPRTRVADLLHALRAHGAVVVGFDALFADIDRTSPQTVAKLWKLDAAGEKFLSALPDHDVLLGQTLAKGGAVVGMALDQKSARTESGLETLPEELPFRVLQMGENPSERLTRFDGVTLPIPEVRKNAAGLGALNFTPDADGVVRRVPLMFSVDGRVAPSLVAEMLRVAQGAQNYALKGVAQAGAGVQELRIGKIVVPSSAEGEMWVHYTPPYGDRFEPAWKVLNGQTDPSRIQGRLVLVGSSALGLMDLRVSPLGHVMPGVTAHAQALEQILAGHVLQRPAWALGLEALMALAGCLVVGLVGTNARAAVSVAATVAVMTGVFGAVWWAFSHHGLLINAAEPMLWMAFIFVLCSVQRHLATEREQRWIRAAFSRYVSPNRVEHLVQHPDQLELGGKRQECSFIFTDLAGFTTLMESMDPARAVALLNEYLDRMIAIAFAHGGTLDRIVGDAVAIVFSAPLEQADHRQRALQCALEMDVFATAYARRLQGEQDIAFGHTRIGVHTGEVIVGNFGGTTMFDYRALGDAVNTASRLEAVNKHLGTRMCVSMATLSASPNVAARPVGHLVLKGKTQALEVWEPQAAQCAGCTPMDAFLQAYRAMEALDPAAVESFQELANAYPNDPLVALHLQRLRQGESGVQMVMLEK